jgi:hypothetical protein
VAELTKEMLAILESKQIHREVALAVVAELCALFAAPSVETIVKNRKRKTV